MKATKSNGDELRPEYDLAALLSGGVRGKYAEGYGAGSKAVVLEPAPHLERLIAPVVGFGKDPAGAGPAS